MDANSAPSKNQANFWFMNYRRRTDEVCTSSGAEDHSYYVVLLPEKSERRRKSPRTNAGDETKYGTIAASAPAGKKSGTEGPIVTPARYCEKVVGWQLAVVGSLRSFVGLEAKGRHALPVCVGVVPSVWYVDADLGRHRKWNRRQAIGASTPNDKVECEHDNPGDRNMPNIDATAPP
jgi:hypothetical protein